jgi:hypothetical protein
MLTTPDHDDALTSVPTFGAPGPKPGGFYGDCDSATGQEGTTFRAEEFNELIVNLRALLDAAAVTGTKGTATMLRTMLRRLYAGAVTTVVATQTLTPDHAGLVLVDATAGNLVLTLPSAAALPAGSPTLQFYRIDTSANTARVIPAAGQAMRRGSTYLALDAPLVLRSDGVATWFPLQIASVVTQPATINVATTGVPTPVNPFQGDPFDSLARAMTFLAAFDLRAQVTIQIAAGTYVSTVPLFIGRPNSQLTAIRGAGVGQTILQYNGCSGLQVQSPLRYLGGLTIQGDKVGATSTGLWLLRGTVDCDAPLTVRNFTLHGVQLEFSGRMTMLGTTNALVVEDNGGYGLTLDGGSQFITAGPITAQRNAGAANVSIGTNSFLYVDALTTNAGQRVLIVDGGRASARRIIGIDSALRTTDSVLVTRHAVLSNFPTSVAGDWDIRTSTNFGDVVRCERYGLIDAGVAFATATKGVTSPAINTLGNTQAWISAS